jgi:hypothetical protein
MGHNQSGEARTDVDMRRRGMDNTVGILNRLWWHRSLIKIEGVRSEDLHVFWLHERFGYRTGIEKCLWKR